MFIYRKSAPAFAALLASLTLAGVAKADITASASVSSQGTSAQVAGVTVSASSQGLHAKAGSVSASTSSQGTNVDGLGVKANVGRISASSNGTIDPAVTVKAGSIQLAPKATVRLRARRTAQSALRGTKRIARHTVRSVRSLLDTHVSGTVNARAGQTNARVSIH